MVDREAMVVAEGIAAAVLRAVIPGGREPRLAEGGSHGEDLVVECLRRLRDVGLACPPARGHDVPHVVAGNRGVGHREVHDERRASHVVDDPGAGGERVHPLDVERGLERLLPPEATARGARLAGADLHARQRRIGKPPLLVEGDEVLILPLVHARDHDRLAGAVGLGRDIVERGHVGGPEVAAVAAERRARRRRAAGTQVRARSHQVVEAEDARHRFGQRTGKRRFDGGREARTAVEEHLVQLGAEGPLDGRGRADRAHGEPARQPVGDRESARLEMSDHLRLRLGGGGVGGGELRRREEAVKARRGGVLEVGEQRREPGLVAQRKPDDHVTTLRGRRPADVHRLAEPRRERRARRGRRGRSHSEEHDKQCPHGGRAWPRCTRESRAPREFIARRRSAAVARAADTSAVRTPSPAAARSPPRSRA